MTIPTWQDHLEMAADEIFRPFWNAVSADQYLPSNVIEHDDKFVIEVSVPGVDQKDVSVEFSNRLLTVEAKRGPPDAKGTRLKELWSGTATRKFYLNGVSGDNISAKFNNGLLVIEAPKTAPTKRTIKIV